ncbi:hypothetical protein V8C35DRAFT_181007 [Trichoderma chlorosporum]
MWGVLKRPASTSSSMQYQVPIYTSKLLHLSSAARPLPVEYLQRKEASGCARRRERRHVGFYTSPSSCFVRTGSSLRGSVTRTTKGGHKIRAARTGMRFTSRTSSMWQFSQFKEKGVLPSYAKVLRIPTPSVLVRVTESMETSLFRIRSPPPILVLLSANSRNACFQGPCFHFPAGANKPCPGASWRPLELKFELITSLRASGCLVLSLACVAVPASRGHRRSLSHSKYGHVTDQGSSGWPAGWLSSFFVGFETVHKYWVQGRALPTATMPAVKSDCGESSSYIIQSINHNIPYKYQALYHCYKHPPKESSAAARGDGRRRAS